MWSGLAMGGPIALSLAAQWPSAVRSLVIADAFVDMREVGGARIPEWEKAIMATTMESFGRQYAKTRLMPSAPAAAHDDMTAAVAKVSPRAYIDTMKAIFEIEFSAEVAAVCAPTLVIFGDNDEVTPRHHSQANRRRHPRGGAEDDPRRRSYREHRSAHRLQSPVDGIPRRSARLSGFRKRYDRTSANRASGRSSIGKWIRAATTPRITALHQITS